jgi:glycosyltransferase involved in cell wall biosynthesis
MARVLYTVNIARFFVSHRLPLALAARAAGHDVHVATADDAPEVATIRAAGLPWHGIPLEQHGTSPLGELRTLAALSALDRRLRPALVHLVSIKPVVHGGLAARLTRVPAVVAAMSGLGQVFDDDAAGERLRRRVLPAMRVALAHPNAMLVLQHTEDRDRLVDLGVVAPERTRIIRGSGVDLARFIPTPPPDGELPVVLFAGRLMWRKGVGRFVELARALAGRARFVVVGYPEPSAPDAVPLDDVEAWAAEGAIEWWGRRDDDMPAVFAAADVVVLPSTYGEGVPKVLIEAAASARPIVATDVPGCRDVCRDGETGRLVAPDDAEALVTAVAELLDDPEGRARLGHAGRALAEAEYGLDRITRETLALYDELLTR